MGQTIVIGQNSRPARTPTRAATDGPRVGFIYPVWQPLGGVERHTLTLLKHAKGINWSGLAAICPDLVNREALAKLSEIMPATGAEGLARLKATSDVLIVWGFTHQIDFLDDYKGKVVSITHGDGEWSAAQLLPVLPFASACVSVSELTVRAYPPEFRSRVKVIRNGVEFDRLAPSLRRQECRDALALDPSSFVVGTLGRLSEEKNPLAAAQAVQELGGKAVALYVGDNADKAIANRFMAQANRIAPDRIKWIRDVNHDAVGDYYRAMDCFIMASLQEGGPLVSVEAWFAGVPQVATPVGMLPELERTYGELTWQVPINPTPRELATAIREVTARTDDSRIHRARHVAITELSATAFAAQWSQLLRSL